MKEVCCLCACGFLLLFSSCISHSFPYLPPSSLSSLSPIPPLSSHPPSLLPFPPPPPPPPPPPSPSDRTPHLILNEHPMAVTSLAVDWDSQNLYWVDSQEKRVEVSRTDGTNRRVLHSGMVNPTGLALDPESM